MTKTDTKFAINCFVFDAIENMSENMRRTKIIRIPWSFEISLRIKIINRENMMVPKDLYLYQHARVFSTLDTFRLLNSWKILSKITHVPSLFLIHDSRMVDKANEEISVWKVYCSRFCPTFPANCQISHKFYLSFGMSP